WKRRAEAAYEDASCAVTLRERINRVCDVLIKTTPIDPRDLDIFNALTGNGAHARAPFGPGRPTETVPAMLDSSYVIPKSVIVRNRVLSPEEAAALDRDGVGYIRTAADVDHDRRQSERREWAERANETKTPAGRLEVVSEGLARGFIDKRLARKLLDFAFDSEPIEALERSLASTTSALVESGPGIAAMRPD